MSAPLQYVPTASPEDQARAQLYGLVASLFYAAPDAQLLSALVHAEGFRDDDEARTEQGRSLAADVPCRALPPATTAAAVAAPPAPTVKRKFLRESLAFFWTMSRLLFVRTPAPLGTG